MTDWPGGMTREPWRHQQAAYDFLGGKWFEGETGVALFSDMGTGKSLVALALWKAYGFRRVLIVSGTKAMVQEWADMARDEAALPVVPLTGPVPKRADTLAMRYDGPDATLGFVTNVESYWREPLSSAILTRHWDCVIFDESQKIKSPGSRASRFAFRLGLQTPYRLIMTGTPMHDKPLDVYGQYRFINPLIFGTSYNRFRSRYADLFQIKPGIFKVTGYKNEDELNAKIYDVAFRVDDDVLDLPPVHHIERRVQLGKEARGHYQRLKDDFVTTIQGMGILIASNALSKLLRLQQITSGILAYTDDETDEQATTVIDRAKYESLVDLLDELPDSEPVVVFGRFSHDLKNVKAAAEATGRAYFEQSGQRAQWQLWREDQTGAVLGVQSQSGNAGINLTRARYAVFLSYTFSYGDYRQAFKRLNRPGQRETLFVYHINADQTVDGYIRRTLATKQSITTELLLRDFDNGNRQGRFLPIAAAV